MAVSRKKSEKISPESVEQSEFSQKSARSKHAVAVTSPVHFLTDQQRIFVDAIIKQKPPIVAARMAGYAKPEANAYLIIKQPKIQEAIKYLHKKHEKVADMSRKKVMDGMLEAIDMAKIQADPGNMIAGWREIAKMCGYYAPEVKKIDINISAKRVIDKLETLTDEDLIRMIEDESKIIEAEAVEVLDDIQQISDQDFPEA